MTSALRVAALLLLPQAGCATSTPDHFFVLTDVERAVSPPSGSYAGSLVVDPVSLPELVDRPQFVVQGERGRVMILEQQRWAEPLRSGVARLMAAQLGRLLGTTSVSSSDGVLARPDHRVAVDIRRLDSAPGRGVTVEALWSVEGADGTSKTGYSRGQASSPDGDYGALVAALAQALGAVSQDIADAVAGKQSP